jgi:hypothetical protein
MILHNPSNSREERFLALKELLQNATTPPCILLKEKERSKRIVSRIQEFPLANLIDKLDFLTLTAFDEGTKQLFRLLKMSLPEKTVGACEL